MTDLVRIMAPYGLRSSSGGDFGAGDVPITDTGGHFVSGTVEGALQEIGEGSGSHTHVFGEDHSSSCNGSLKTFPTLNPFVATSTLVFLNGLLQRRGDGYDYTEASDHASITFGTAPLTGDVLVCAYLVGASTTTGGAVLSGPYPGTFSPSAAVLFEHHDHSNQSDGTLTPDQLVAAYLGAGFGALQISDHDKVTSQPIGITSAIQGSELTTTLQHLISLNSGYLRGTVTDAQTQINAVVGDGGQVVIAHPKWSVGMTYAEMAALTGYLGIEIHNAHCVTGAGVDPVAYPGFDLGDWDNLLRNVRRNIWGFSGDDFHTADSYHRVGVGRERVFVATNTPTNIMASLAAGNFVADVSNDGVTPGYPVRTTSAVSVTCPGAVRVEAWGATGLLQGADGDSLTYNAIGDEKYVRLVAIGDYSDPFDSLLTPWSIVGGSWSASGVLSFTSADSSVKKVILRKHREGDFEAQIDILLSGSGAAGSLMFNVLNANDYYILRLGATDGTAPNWQNRLAVGKTTIDSFGSAYPLDSVAFTPALGTWYTVKMAYEYATGTIHAKVWTRGTAEPDGWMVNVSDVSWRHGAFGVRGGKNHSYDNLYIKGFRTYYQPIAVDPGA